MAIAKNLKYIAVLLTVPALLKYAFILLAESMFFRHMDVEIVTSSVATIALFGVVYLLVDLGWNGAFACFWLLISTSAIAKKEMFVILVSICIAAIASTWFYIKHHLYNRPILQETIALGVASCAIYIAIGLVLLSAKKKHAQVKTE